MSKKIIIDSLYQEEVRLVLCENDNIEEFDYQNNIKKSTKGNIYLAKITRIEPSLQAAFVNYGQEKHGFLPFSEIQHEDYKIPTEDKKTLHNLLEKQKKEIASLEKNTKHSLKKNNQPEQDNAQEEGVQNEKLNNQQQSIDQLKETHYFELQQFYKKYKIQDVIRRNQEVLVQVAKEERGNKGASFTMQISLAGRYCVLMPNTKNFDGISKRITDQQERQRIKEILKKLREEENIAEGILIRTACINKTLTEIKRDFTYLIRVWKNIKNNIKSSKAPTFLYEEGDIIKRCIRDMYNSDVDEIIISGNEAYQTAKEFLKSLLPKHTHKIVEYTSPTPIFTEHNLEEQISKLYDNIVPLQSGGYLVINQTEALVAIDINSGKATNESDIENTALKTNLEAIKELAKQIRLRDLSGLIVIDFIDMGERKNRELIEKEVQKALSKDRARTQIGQISEFGILEMSRQRMRNSLIDHIFSKCSLCNGKGYHRAAHSTALAILRAIRNENCVASKKIVQKYNIRIAASKDVILNLLNEHQEKIIATSSEFGINITFSMDESVGMDGFFLETQKIEENKALPMPMSKIDDTPYEVEQQIERRYSALGQNKQYGNDRHNDRSSSRIRNENIEPGRNVTQQNNNQEHYKSTQDSSRKSHFSSKKDIRKNYRHKTQNATSNNKNKLTYRSNAQLQDKNSESLLTKIWKKIID